MRCPFKHDGPIGAPWGCIQPSMISVGFQNFTSDYANSAHAGYDLAKTRMQYQTGGGNAFLLRMRHDREHRLVCLFPASQPTCCSIGIAFLEASLVRLSRPAQAFPRQRILHWPVVSMVLTRVVGDLVLCRDV
jgi:hypothetical protein